MSGFLIGSVTARTWNFNDSIVSPGRTGAIMQGCTVHGFKGWETRALVMGIDTWPDSLRRTYVALTRVKADRGGRAAYISVVNGDPSMARFGEFFENPVLEWPALTAIASPAPRH